MVKPKIVITTTPAAEEEAERIPLLNTTKTTPHAVKKDMPPTIILSPPTPTEPSPGSHIPDIITRKKGWYPLTTIVTLASLLASYLIFNSYTQLQSTSLNSSNGLGRWGCRMSWMSPGYVRLTGPTGQGLRGLEGKHSLYLYREGGLQDTSQISGKGHPVIFIPGNAGNYKQVRSIASSAAHQYFEGEHSGREDHDHWEKGGVGALRDHPTGGFQELDFFAVDYNEEFSAFHSQTLLDQSLYLAHTIQYVLSLYPPTSKPQKVSLIGHSMGGIVARHAITMNLPRGPIVKDGETTTIKVIDLVDVIVTMSSPHQLPPVLFDRDIQRISNEVSSFWESTTSLTRPILVSICGGIPDSQIPSESCPIPLKITSEDNDLDRDTFSVFTTGMEGVWTGVDHQAMVWCDQVRWRVAKVLLEMVGSKAGKAGMVKVAREWFLGEHDLRGIGSEKERLELDLSGMEKMPSGDPWIRGGPSQRLVSIQSSTKFITILGSFQIGAVGPSGSAILKLYKCSMASSICSSIDELGDLKLLPPSLPLQDQGKVAFPNPGKGVSSFEGMTWVEVDVSAWEEEQEMLIVMEGVGWAVVGMEGIEQTFAPIRSTYTFPRVAHTALVYNVVNDASPTTNNIFSPLLEHETPFPASTQETQYAPQFTHSALIHQHSIDSPFISYPHSPAYISLTVYQDPTVRSMQLSLQVDWMASLGLMVSRYRMVVVAWCLGLVMMLFGMQFRQFRITGYYPSLFPMIEVFVSGRLVLITGGLLLSAILQSSLPSSITHQLGLENCLLGNATHPSLAWTVPLVLLVCFGLVIISGLLLDWVVPMLSMFLKLVIGSAYRPDPPARFLPKHLLSMLTLLVLVATIVPYQFAFLVMFCIHLMTTVNSRLDQTQIKYNYNFSILLLLFWLLPMNVTVLIVWARNLIAHWQIFKPFGSDHNVIFIAPVLAVGEMCSAGLMMTRKKNYIIIVESLFSFTSFLAFFIGGRYPYVLYDLSMVIFTTLTLFQVVRRVRK